MNLIKKVSIILICIFIFSFLIPGISMAKDAGIGGKLFKPIQSLLITIGDVLYDIVHKVILGQDHSLLNIDLTANWLDGLRIFAIVVGVIIAIAAVAALLISGQVWVTAAFKAIGVALKAAAPILGKAVAGITIAKLSAGTVILASLAGGAVAGVSVYNALPEDELHLPIYSISPEEIFSGKIALFDVDFFNPSGTKVTDENGETKWVQEYVVSEDDNGNKKTIPLESTAGNMQATIATWYTKLRDIAIVGMLSILVYIGIRILISSTSNDKAKYKQMIVDWVVALCLLFVMQYIMSFANIIVGKVTDLVSTSADKNAYLATMPYKERIKEQLKKQYDYDFDEEKNVQEVAIEVDEEGNVKKTGKYMIWKTNLLGIARIQAQNDIGKSGNYFGYTIIFLVLIFYTIFFVFTYLKRVIYMAFLTIIAPLVALTYPIDKINDGKAQAFNMWLKEYIFNLLIQPLHLLLYTLLITAAYELSTQNIIYTLVAIGFMMPAEKLMRKFFGFEKAQTPGMLGGAAGAAMVMAGMNKLMSRGPKGGKDSSGKGASSTDEKEDSKPPRTADFDSDKYLADGDDNSNAEDTKDTLFGMGGSNPRDDASNNVPPSNNSLNGENIPENPEGHRYTEDIIEERAERAQQAMKDFWDTSPQAVYARHYAQKFWNSDLVGIGRKSAKGLANLTKSGLRKAGNTRFIKGIRNSRTWKGAKDAGRFYAKGMANKISNKVKNAHLGRKAIRMAGGAALGATAGAIGMAAGIASGDPSKAFQYAATGTFGGYKLGSGTTNSVANALTVEGTKEKFEEGYYGEEQYKQRQLDKQVKAAQRDWEMQQYFERKLGSKDKAKDLMNSEIFDKCIRNGLKDQKEIYAVHKLKEDNKMNDEKAIAVALTTKEYVKDKNTNRLGAKEDEDLNKTLYNRAKRNQYIHTDEEAVKIGKETRKLMDSWSKFKHED